MVSEKDLKRLVEKAKADPVFFDSLFSNPQKALAAAGLDRLIKEDFAEGCSGITCSWTCSWTGTVESRLERGAKLADCGGITCSWTCSWTGFSERARQAPLRELSDCGGITCSWTCSWTGARQADFKEGRMPSGALTAEDCGGITCGWTCSWTGFRQEIERGRPAKPV